MVRVYDDAEDELTTDHVPLPTYKDQVRPQVVTVPLTGAVTAASPLSHGSSLPLAHAVVIDDAEDDRQEGGSPIHGGTIRTAALTDSASPEIGAEKKSSQKEEDANGGMSRGAWLWIGATLLLLAAVLAGFCGAGKCSNSNSSSSSSSSNNSNNNNSNNSTAPNTTTADGQSQLEAYLRSISLLSDQEEAQDGRLREAEDEAILFLVENADDAPLSDVDRFHARQQFALLNLYYATRNDTTHWNNNSLWLTTTLDNNECQWFGVTCVEYNLAADESNPFADLGVELVVQSVLLPGNGLNGRLSPNLCLLDYLAYLDLASNLISGTLPAELSYCSSLLEFSMQYNALTGSVPSAIGATWQNINKFSVFGNPTMSGTIPSALGLWTNLYSVDIGDMGLTGTFPMFTNWSSVAYLYVNSNQLTGSLPESIGTALSGIEVFYISDNGFNGTLPTTIGLWSNLREFAIDANGFSGAIPDTILNWVYLDQAYLQNNALTGTVPEDLCSTLTFTAFVTDIPCPCCLNTTLEPTPSPPFVMDVEMYLQSVAESAGSNTSQTMDAELAAIAWLIDNNEEVQLFPYDAVGQFRIRQRYALLTLYFATTENDTSWISAEGWLDEPDECLWKGVECSEFEPETGLGNQNVVEGIFLELNGLQGKLSPDLSLLSHMKYFDVSGNRISGTLPSALGKCGCLLELIIHNNTITGTLPPDYGPTWTNLYSFSAWDNDLSGPLPESYGNWTALTSIDLDANGITGTFPSSICGWHEAQYFYFAENSMTGRIPDSFANSTPSMKHFDVNGNSFTGTISRWYGEAWTEVELFSVADNQFTGVIPEALYNWPLAYSVDFSGNDGLKGTVPALFCDFNLTYLAADAGNVTCACCDCCGYE